VASAGVVALLNAEPQSENTPIDFADTGRAERGRDLAEYGLQIVLLPPPPPPPPSGLAKFLKVSSTGIVCSRSWSKLTFENFDKARGWAIFVLKVGTRQRISGFRV